MDEGGDDQARVDDGHVGGRLEVTPGLPPRGSEEEDPTLSPRLSSAWRQPILPRRPERHHDRD